MLDHADYAAHTCQHELVRSRSRIAMKDLSPLKYLDNQAGIDDLSEVREVSKKHAFLGDSLAAQTRNGTGQNTT